MVDKADEELVREVLAGNLLSFETLVDRYQDTVFNLVRMMVGHEEHAKDISQDIFIRIFEKMNTFNANYRFFSWVYRITLNETLSWKRRNREMERLQEYHYQSIPDEEGDQPERSLILSNSIKSLKPGDQMLVLFKYFCGLTYEEIAEIQHITVKKVRSRLFEAREKLRLHMLANGYFDHE